MRRDDFVCGFSLDDCRWRGCIHICMDRLQQVWTRQYSACGDVGFSAWNHGKRGYGNICSHVILRAHESILWWCHVFRDNGSACEIWSFIFARLWIWCREMVLHLDLRWVCWTLVFFVKTSFVCVQKVLGEPFSYFACSPYNWNLCWKRFLHESLANCILEKMFQQELQLSWEFLHEDGIRFHLPPFDVYVKEDTCMQEDQLNHFATYKVGQTSHLRFVLCVSEKIRVVSSEAVNFVGFVTRVFNRTSWPRRCTIARARVSRIQFEFSQNLFLIQMMVLLKVPLLNLSFKPSFEPFLNTNGGFA